MKIIRSVVGALALGAGFGALTSLVKDASLGGVWVMRIAEVARLLLDVGWSWAALAVAAGWLAGTRTRGVAAGVLALTAATTVYYCTESTLRGLPLAWQVGWMLPWLLASLLFGPPLGAVGATIKNHGVIGLLARLTVPVGAIVEMTFMPPEIFLIGRPTETSVRVIVCAAAAMGVAVVLIRFLIVKQSPRREPKMTHRACRRPAGIGRCIGRSARPAISRPIFSPALRGPHLDIEGVPDPTHPA
ncbi:hypothetical protein ACFQVD_09125 [Streptosporangium amethystogenes subsp. fukuiense]|uniref:Integral membrane protein n=1 Tax=Streptosporangium amethystogenes subsp. fukuiense TaxID=698418 RepID=A0ABW2SW22_9ACTN